MLLCLDRRQRIVYILGGILAVPDSVGAELLEISRDAFRQKLARARRDLHSFMHGQCGLINGANPCRCAKKTQGFIKAGYLDPHKLLFARANVTHVHEVAPGIVEGLEALDAAYGEIYRDHPFHTAPDYLAALRRLLDSPECRSVLAGCEEIPVRATDTVIALERGALDRWGKGDPLGYIEIYAPDVTYFDPVQDKRIDGLDAMKKMLAPYTGKIRVDRFDMIDPKVQQHGEMAVLTFNLLSYRTQPDRTEVIVARWNATAVYRAMEGTWKSIHVHWSYIKPELKTPVSEERP